MSKKRKLNKTQKCRSGDPLFICSYCNSWVPGIECSADKFYQDCIKETKWVPPMTAVRGGLVKIQNEIGKLLDNLDGK